MQIDKVHPERVTKRIPNYIGITDVHAVPCAVRLVRSTTQIRRRKRQAPQEVAPKQSVSNTYKARKAALKVCGGSVTG